jgi:hypothetical protein
MKRRSFATVPAFLIIIHAAFAGIAAKVSQDPFVRRALRKARAMT